MSSVLKVSLSSFLLIASNAQSGDICGYAPLCGSGDTSFDWQTNVEPDGFEGTVILGAELEFSDCCKLADTTPTQDCQIVNPTGESYRYITANVPICGNGGEDCTDSCENYQLVINAQFEDASTSDGCCDSCSCFGDPQCIPFSGPQDMQTWVLCDGREIPNEDSMWDMCRITKSQCEQEKDHAGNQCVYLAEDKRGRGWVVGKEGSPCQPSPNSPPSTILMYSVPSADFNLTLQQGDRGIITDVYLTLESGYFTLNAEACLVDGDGAWTHRGTSSLPAFFSHNNVVRGYDQHWTVVDPESGIAIAIRCHGNHYDGDDTLYVPRINVEDVSDPVPRGNNADGFCVSGEFETGKATTKNTNEIIKGEYCTDALEDEEERLVYRAICKNDALPSSGVESCIYHFCSANYLPLFDSIDACENAFEQSTAEGFCRAIVYTEMDYSKCMAQWFDIGAVETVTQYYDDRSGCSSSLVTEFETCQDGIILQYYRNNQWNNEIYIPSDYCSDEPIVISYCEHPYLFNRQIRIAQKSSGAQCGSVSPCTTVEGFLGKVTLVQNTPYPTQFPTVSPTGSPSIAPTPYPSEQPDTLAPTPYPTPFPVGSVPTPCPTEGLCGSGWEFVPYQNDDYEFHVDMGACCPVVCPGQESENRSQGTQSWFCGHSDGANGTVGDSVLGQECKDDYTLTIQVMFDHEEECCKKCTCYGDPRCYSFDDVFEEFILCDARTPGGTVEDRCIMRKDTCLQQTDQSGNQCAWTNPYATVPNYSNEDQQWAAENAFSVARYGSPCRYDKSVSPAPMITMYDTTSGIYKLDVEQGERGYIQAVSLTLASGQFELSASKCIAGENWDVISGSTSQGLFSRAKYGKEYVWTVQDPATGILARIRCTGHLYDNEYVLTFLNVEAIYDYDADRMRSAEGFCATSEMPEKDQASTDYTASLVSGGYCDNWNENATDVMKREVVRLITNNPGVTNTGAEYAYRTFCSSFYMPGWSSIGRCTSDFVDADNVEELIQLFCRAVTRETDACEENLQVLASTSGYKAAFTEGYENYITNYEMQCEINLNQLPTSIEQDADTCVTGVELQFWNPRRGEWVTYAAFPDNLPCSGYTVVVNYDDHPKLFKNPLRLYQSHNFKYCNSCTQVGAVMGWFEFNVA